MTCISVKLNSRRLLIYYFLSIFVNITLSRFFSSFLRSPYTLSIVSGSIPSKWRARTCNLAAYTRDSAPDIREHDRRAYEGSMVVQWRFILPGLSVNFCEWTGWPSRERGFGRRACASVPHLSNLQLSGVPREFIDGIWRNSRTMSYVLYSSRYELCEISRRRLE